MKTKNMIGIKNAGEPIIQKTVALDYQTWKRLKELSLYNNLSLRDLIRNMVFSYQPETVK